MVQTQFEIILRIMKTRSNCRQFRFGRSLALFVAFTTDNRASDRFSNTTDLSAPFSNARNNIEKPRPNLARTDIRRPVGDPLPFIRSSTYVARELTRSRKEILIARVRRCLVIGCRFNCFPGAVDDILRYGSALSSTTGDRASRSSSVPLFTHAEKHAIFPPCRQLPANVHSVCTLKTWRARDKATTAIAERGRSGAAERPLYK